ncbi:MAG: 4Fe-4S binding protein [Clostridia bacterium]|nr:4Fe-4S binding protein [Clostridia bacterium]
MADYAALKKGGFMRQKQKNYFSMRLKVVGGQVTAKQLAKVSEIADRYGHGYVHLTSRQGIEIPFIHLDDIDEVKAEMAKGDVESGTCGPRVRTVTACQGRNICPSGCIDTTALAEKISDHYFGRELPHKFKFGVTGCQNNCLKTEENDIGVKGGIEVAWKEDACIRCGLCEKVCRSNAISISDGRISIDKTKCNYCGRCVKSCPTDAYEENPGYIVSFGGTFGNYIYKGEELVPIIHDEETLFRVMDAAISFFDKYANAGERFRKTIERVGIELLKQQVEEAYHG